MVANIAHSAMTQIQPLLSEKAQTQQTTSNIDAKIQSTIQQAVKDITDYLATNPASEEDFKALQLFKDELSQASQSASDIGMTHLGAIDQLLEGQKKQLAILKSAIQTLPEDPKNLPPGLTEVPLLLIKQAADTQVKEAAPVSGKVVDGKEYFEKALKELDRIKDKLGGSPHFPGGKPSLKDPDANKTFLGVPMPAVKDWFRMTLKNEWVPAFFWKAAAKYFGVTKEDMPTQYEQAHIYIQRFGLLIANKERFLDILNKQDKEHYTDILFVTGMMWHPDLNGTGTEKVYMEFLEKFLTEDLEAAKKKGDDALVDYFNAFKGVCFEDRCRKLEEYSNEHPIDQEIAEVKAAAEEMIDIDPGDSAVKGFNVICQKLMTDGKEVNALNILEVAREHILGKNFTTNSGAKAKATLQDFQNYVVNGIANAMVIDPYQSVEDVLKIELEILKESGKEVNADNFKKQLEKLDGKDILSTGDFSTSDPAIEEFISKNIA